MSLQSAQRLPSNPASATVRETAGDAPLCVDLDGTLIKTDLLFESALLLLRERLWLVFLLPFWLLKGKAYLKRQIADRVDLNAATLPYRQEVLDWLTEERSKGRTLVLATASDVKLAQAVADHLKLFDLVLATTVTLNLLGRRKRDVLIERFGRKGFAYAGDASVDLPIWEEAAEAIVVGASASTESQAKKLGNVTRVFPRGGGALRAFIKQIRVKQWVKNILVFVPVITAHKLGDWRLIAHAGGAFVAFSLCASSVYIVNDLMDLEADRRHRSKKHRPFASGTLPLTVGFVAAPLLFFASFVIAAFLSPEFIAVLALYLVVTNAYTFWLKREALIDVICLAGLYTVRIFAGGQATNLPVSPWLIALSMFGFLSLAMVKRVSELRVAKESNEEHIRGRGYSVHDHALLSQAGITSGYLSVLVFALYIHGEEVKALYHHPSALWFVCPLLFYWISRVWMLTHRGVMHDDPVVFAVRDRMSYIVGALAAVVVYLAR